MNNELNSMNSTNNVNEFKTITINNKEVEVKQYLSILDKITFINFIAEQTISNNIMGSVYFNYMLVKYYTDIKLSEDQSVFDFFDEYEKLGLFKKIKEAIPSSEINKLENGIKFEVDKQNSFIGVFSAFLNDLLLKIPNEKGIQKIIKTAGKEFKNFKPENLQMISKVFGGQVGQISKDDNINKDNGNRARWGI